MYFFNVMGDLRKRVLVSSIFLLETINQCQEKIDFLSLKNDYDLFTQLLLIFLCSFRLNSCRTFKNFKKCDFTTLFKK